RVLVLGLYDVFFFSSRRRHTRFSRDWSSDVCSSDLKYISRRNKYIFHYLHLSGVKRALFFALTGLDVLIRWVVVDVTFYSSFWRSEEHTSELQSRENLVCRLLLEKKKKKNIERLSTD